jgi:HAD superfamily hydrolase (TIGR01450 family)
MTWLLDLDGVVWLSEQAIPGSAEAIARLRARGERVVFLTNNSYATLADYVAKLERMGVPTSPEDVMTSAQAAARLIEPGETVLVCGGPGVEEAVRDRGATPLRTGRADAVIVGWHQDFDYSRLRAAFDAVRQGARLIGTNDDATYPTPEGPLPGGGSILAAVSYASGATPTVAGKPFPPIVELLHERVRDAVVMVGDRPSTDGLLAQRLGIPFALVLSGVTADDAVIEPKPEYVATNLAALVDQIDQIDPIAQSAPAPQA